VGDRWSRYSARSSGTTREQLAYLHSEIDAVEAELIEREAELVDLRVELSAFRVDYDPRVGRKLEELEEVESELERCRKRIEEYRQWGAGGLPRTAAGNAYVPVEEQYRRTWQQPRETAAQAGSSRTARSGGLGTAIGSAGRAPGQATPVEERIKKMYRQLCRRYHPDLTQDAAERARRTQIMAAINAAYGERAQSPQQSLMELEALAERADYSLWEEAGTAEQRVVALTDKLRRLQRRLEEVRREIRELLDSPAMEMSLQVKLAWQTGRDLLAEVETEVERDLLRKRTELEFMRAQLRQFGIS
jgi:chromosome segregation ATPase